MDTWPPPLATTQSELDEIAVAGFLREFEAATSISASPLPAVQQQQQQQQASGNWSLQQRPQAFCDARNEARDIRSAFGASMVAPMAFLSQGRHQAFNYALPASIPRSLAFPPQEGGYETIALPIEMPGFESEPWSYFDDNTPVADFTTSSATYNSADQDQDQEDSSDDDQLQPSVTTKSISFSGKRSRSSVLTREIGIACKRCHLKLGIVRVIGASELFVKPFICDIMCEECVDDEIRPTVPLPRSKAKNASLGGKMERQDCRVCRNVVGFGGVRLVLANQRNDSSSVWIKPDFSVEYLCDSCFSQFRLCSSCGGGTRNLIGKYRPKEMFLNDRKTCLLKHKRTASLADVVFISYRLPVSNEATDLPDLMPWVLAGNFEIGGEIPYSQSMHIATTLMQQDIAKNLTEFHYFFFDGATMQDYPSRCTWDLLQTAAAKVGSEVSRYIRGSPPLRPRPPETRIRRYIGIAFQMQRGSKRRAQPASSSKTRNLNAEPPNNNSWNIAGMSVSTWNISARVFLNDRVTYFGSSNPGQNKVFATVLKMNRARVSRDARAESIELPLHHVLSVNNMHRRAHMTKLLVVMHTIGFVTLEVYCAMNGLDINAMEMARDNGHVEDLVEDYETFAKRWEE